MSKWRCRVPPGRRRNGNGCRPSNVPAHIYAIADGVERERERFERLLVMEQGKTLAEAQGEVADTLRYLRYAAEAARRIGGDIFPSDLPNEQLFIHKVPYGVTVGLCAYNYPLALIGRKVGPALVTGNTMVLKPHEATPVTASEFCRVAWRRVCPRASSTCSREPAPRWAPRSSRARSRASLH